MGKTPVRRQRKTHDRKNDRETKMFHHDRSTYKKFGDERKLKNRLSFMAAIMTLFESETKTSSLIFTYLTDVRRWFVVPRKLLL